MSNGVEIQSYEQYVAEFINLLQIHAEAAGMALSIIRDRLYRPNECWDALILRMPDKNTAPNIYMEHFYNAYMEEKATLEEQVDGVVGILQGADINIPDEFEALNYVKEHAFFRLMNADMNKELAAETAAEPIQDLVLVPYIMLKSDEEGQASCRLTRNLQQHLQLSDSEVKRMCFENLAKEEFVVKSLNRIMAEMRGMATDIPEDVLNDMFPKNPIYVISNKSNVGGAIALASPAALNMVSEELGDNFFIIPSSIHECLAIPVSFGLPPEILKSMCEDVNANPEIMERKDILSDNIYYYDGKSLHICNSAEQFEQLHEEAIRATQHIGRRI